MDPQLHKMVARQDDRECKDGQKERELRQEDRSFFVERSFFDAQDHLVSKEKETVSDQGTRRVP